MIQSLTNTFAVFKLERLIVLGLTFLYSLPYLGYYVLNLMELLAAAN